jgi:hypothetical protein
MVSVCVHVWNHALHGSGRGSTCARMVSVGLHSIFAVSSGTNSPWDPYIQLLLDEPGRYFTSRMYRWQVWQQASVFMNVTITYNPLRISVFGMYFLRCVACPTTSCCTPLSTDTLLQVALIEIFRCNNVVDFMVQFDAVCTVVDGRITSGVVTGIGAVIGQVPTVPWQKFLYCTSYTLTAT